MRRLEEEMEKNRKVMEENKRLMEQLMGKK